MRKAARRVAKGTGVKRVRVAEMTAEQVAEHVRDVQNWRQVRCPGPARDQFAYFGLVYRHTQSGLGGFPETIAIPADSVLLPHHFREFSALVMVSLTGIAELETQTADSLCAGDAQ